MELKLEQLQEIGLMLIIQLLEFLQFNANTVSTVQMELQTFLRAKGM